jgi:mannose-6-phosphate isomerase-like protein (cupin superfamily)
VSEPGPKIHVVGAGEGAALRLRMADVRVKANAATSEGGLTCVETRDPPGFFAPPHIHHRSSEAFYVLEGSYSFRGREDEVQCEAGSFVVVPAGTIHGYTAGDRGGRLLIIYVPPGIDEMWREMQDASADAPLANHERNAIGRKYGTEWV